MPHIHKLIDFTVEVFVVHKNKVLLRKHDKYKIWLSVGGHIELDEDPNQAAVREVKEEVGLDISLYNTLRPFNKHTPYYHELIPPYFLNRHKISSSHEHVALTYFAKAKTTKVTQGENEKSDECRWFTKEEIIAQKDITDTIREYSLKALQS